MVDPPVGDGHRPPGAALGAHDAHEVGTGRSHQEASRLEHQSRALQARMTGPCRELGRDAPAQVAEIERRLVVGVGDAQPATRVQQPEPQAMVSGTGPCSVPEPSDVLDDAIGVAHVGGTEGMQP
jgi:hypothetical protein